MNDYVLAQTVNNKISKSSQLLPQVAECLCQRGLESESFTSSHRTPLLRLFSGNRFEVVFIASHEGGVCGLYGGPGGGDQVT